MSNTFLRAAAIALAAATLRVHAAPVPIADLVRHAELTEASLSPSGEFVALAVPSEDGKETRLEIMRLDGSGKTQTLRFPQRQHVTGIVWTSDRQIVLSRARNRPFRPQPVSYGELMTSDIDGKNQGLLFGYELDDLTRSGRRKDQGFADVERVLPGEPGKLLVAFTCGTCGDTPDTTIYKVDSVGGERTEVEHSDGLGRFLFDSSGRARIRITADANDEQVLAYRPTAASPWTPLPHAIAGRAIQGGDFTSDPDVAFLEISDAGETAKFYRVDLRAGTRTPVASHPQAEYDTLLRAGAAGEPFGAMYTAGKPAVKYFDPSSEWAKLHAGLLKAFPGELVQIVDTSRDGQRVLFLVGSDRHPGAYYLIDRRDNNRVSLVGERAPWLKPDTLAPTTPVEVTTRDGVKLTAFYTATGDTPRPLVLIPHGGPFGIADTWGYDPDSQFLASRGYGVLRVNYRGSGSRGSTFEQSGWRHWGDRLVEDMVDAVGWAVANHLTRPDQVCIYGASYGGYAAMQAPRVSTGTFKCAVGYAGVYDLPTLVKDKKSLGSDRVQRYFARTLGTDTAELERLSPARHAADIGIPVFLVHGRDDENARVEQYDAMLRALKAAGASPETYVVAGEGHGFYSPEAQAELYRRLETFFGRYLPATP